MTPLLAAAAVALAPSIGPSPAPVVGAACSGPAYHQFDFWIGCALLEQVTPIKGAPSVALIAYDPDATLWRWTGVFGDGRIVSLQGGPQNGDMTLEGDQSGDVDSGLARIVWKVQGDAVSEGGERSKDGKSWSLWFDLDLRHTR